MNFISWHKLSLIPFLVASYFILQLSANGEDVTVNFPNEMTVNGTVTAEIVPDLQYLPSDDPPDETPPSIFNNDNGGSLTTTPSGFSSRLNLTYLVFDDNQITDTPNTTFSYNQGQLGNGGLVNYGSNVTFRLFKCHFDWEEYFDDLNEVLFGAGEVAEADLLLNAPTFTRPSSADYSYTYTFPFSNRQVTLKIPFSMFARGGQFYSFAQICYFMSRWLMDMTLIWSMIWVVFKFQ